MKRTVFFLALVALAASLPGLLSEHRESPAEAPPGGSTDAWSAPVNPSPIVVTPIQPPSGTAAGPFQLASSPGDGPPIVQHQPPIYNAFTNPAEYLNFQIDSDWIRERWPRVSVTPGEDQLTGLRVALVSGPRPVDVHGSLTYYFDNQQSLQRITFRGWTGDPSELVDVLTRRYQFSREDSGAAGFYTASSWGREKGFLRIDYPRTFEQDAPTEQFIVLLEIVNPAGSLTVSQQNQRILQAMGR
jgi:hypothetical protein